jgi:hypothetical protein
VAEWIIERVVDLCRYARRPRRAAKHPARHIDVFAGREHVDDLVVLHVGDGGGEAGVAIPTALDEGGLVEPDGRGLVQPLAIGLKQRRAIGGHRVVQGVPVTGQLGGHFKDGPAPADLDRGPLGRPGGEQTVLGHDPVVLEGPGLLRARRIDTAHPVLLPGQRHWRAKDRKVHVVHHRTVFDLGSSSAGRTSDLAEHLLDHQLDVGPAALVVQDLDILEAHQGPEDFTRVADNEGASCFLAHTSSMEHLRRAQGESGAPAPRWNPKTPKAHEIVGFRLDSENPLVAGAGFEPATFGL